MSLIQRVSMRVVAMFLPEVKAGACIPPEFCFCSGGRKIYSNCLGNCTLRRELC